MLLQRRSSSTASTTVLVRTLSKPVSLKSLLCCAPAEPAHPISSPRIPPELVDYIVELALSPYIEARVSDLSAIAPLTLASFDFRQISLRRFYRELFPLTNPHWSALFQLLLAQDGTARPGQYARRGAFSWVK